MTGIITTQGVSCVRPPEVRFVRVRNAGRSQMAADVVIAMGCGDARPVDPGKRYLNWRTRRPSRQDH